MRSRSAKGLLLALLAAALWSAAGILSFHGFAREEGPSGLTGTLARVLVNLAAILLVQLAVRRERRLPWGDFSWALWGWGLLGAIAVTTFFFSLREIGAGEATLLQGVQGIVVAALGPLFLRQRSSPSTWLAVLGGLAGTFLILGQGLGAGQTWTGKMMALASGLSAGGAYLLLSGTGGRHSPLTTGFYWCLLSLLAAGGLWASGATAPPRLGPAAPWLLGAGLAGTAAQWLTALAYGLAPAALVSSSAYLVPVFSLAWEALWAHKMPGSQATAGIALILASGVALPFLRERRRPASPRGLFS